MTTSPRDLPQLEQHLNDRFAGPGLTILVDGGPPYTTAVYVIRLFWKSERENWGIAAGHTVCGYPYLGVPIELVAPGVQLNCWADMLGWPFAPAGALDPHEGYFDLDPWSQAELLVEAMLLRLKERRDDR